MKHEEFAEQTAKRLEAVADRLEEEGRRLGIHGAVSARAGERVGGSGPRSRPSVRLAGVLDPGR